MALIKIQVSDKESYVNTDIISDIDHVYINKEKCAFSISYTSKAYIDFKFKYKETTISDEIVVKFREFFDNLIICIRTLSLMKDKNVNMEIEQYNLLVNHVFDLEQVNTSKDIDLNDLQHRINLVKKQL